MEIVYYIKKYELNRPCIIWSLDCLCRGPGFNSHAQHKIKMRFSVPRSTQPDKMTPGVIMGR